MHIIETIKKELASYNDRKRAGELENFFKAFPGGYGEGDKFIGITVPNQRRTAKKFFSEINLSDAEKLLNEPFHEYRLTALFMMVYKFEKAGEKEKTAIANMYLKNTARVNNWDLVDSSAEKILGAYLLERPKKILYELVRSKDLWEQRIAMIASFNFIKNNQFSDALKLAEMLIDHEHDLIHKASGWMLREVGNRDFDAEYAFLKKHYAKMPRTMLRYAIEKFDEGLRQRFLKGLI
ncbi:MAG TPA: DNA alkylation repair protein [Candidatus Wallbacteria bacterium]|nr:DNA alkylation repair protein [Candidatus Wallbacteria bacterium]